MLFLFLDFSRVEIQVALISGMFTVLSALIAAFAAAIIGQTIANRRELQTKLTAAISDIEFLLAVEELHCENNKQHLGESRKLKIRKLARDRGVEFSGKFTPGRVRFGQYSRDV